MKKVIVFLADGFEECEGLITVDLLRRAGVEVTTASIMDRREITSSHGIKLYADTMAEEADYAGADMVILPGGCPGTKHLGENAIVREQCLAFAENKMVAAICAAPSVLAGLGITDGKAAACHPSVEDKMGSASLTFDHVVVDGNVITSRGLGTAIPFALKLVEILVDRETADKIAKGICYTQQ